MSSPLTRSLNLNFQKSDSIIYPRTFKNNNFYLNKLSYVKVEEYNRTSGEGPLIIGEFRQDILTVDFMKAINCGKPAILSSVDMLENFKPFLYLGIVYVGGRVDSGKFELENISVSSRN